MLYRSFIKPFFDWLSAALFLLIFFPFFLFLVIAVGLYHRNSPFFCQVRIGQYGKTFKIIKLKTITSSGEITPFLAFLRKTKLDELPQVFNILKGEMSWIGPRPDLPGYYDMLTGENRKILDLKPGITGIASLAFINEEFLLSKQQNPKQFNDEVIFPKKVKMNRYYRRYISFGLDLKIVFKTVVLLLQKRKNKKYGTG